jgi:hypothetical protein
MKHKIKKIIWSVMFFVVFLIITSIVFVVFYKVPAQQTPEQIEYRELYKNLSKDDILTEDEMKQLDEAYLLAYPEN